MENLIATAEFVLNGKTDYGFECKNTPVRMELHPSGAFAYGNQTCMVMKIGNGREECFDTRYDTELRGDGKNFKEWAFDFLKGYIAKGLVATEA